MSDTVFYHQPVLLNESIDQLKIKPDGIYLDATFGGGGHSREILKQLGSEGKLIVFDQDEEARKNAPDDNRIIFIRENFRYAARFVRLLGLGKLNGVLADLGVSSHQFDTAERGFSTRFNAQLDMRMDDRNPVKAADILKKYPESELKKIFEQYGEVTNAKVLAAKVVEMRHTGAPVTINDFKQGISSCIYGNPNKYLAQVFQALRIEVNDELRALKDFLRGITGSLSPGGRMCIITFHSLEDRIVKQWMASESFDNPADEMIPMPKPKLLRIVTKKPVTPSAEEQAQNPRSRSAKLRVAERNDLII